MMTSAFDSLMNLVVGVVCVLPWREPKSSNTIKISIMYFILISKEQKRLFFGALNKYIWSYKCLFGSVTNTF